MELTALVESAGHVCCRYRLEAFRPYLEAAGHRLQIRPWPRRPWHWLRELPVLRRADVVILQRRLPHPALTEVLRRTVGRLVFDFDDAIFLHDSYDPRGLSCPTRLRHFAALCGAADAVVAGNSFLAAAAARWADPNLVHVIPTCVEPGRYPLAEHRRAGTGIELAWIGSASTLQGLRRVSSLLEALGRRWPGLRLKLVCDRFLELHDLPVVRCPWSEAGETEALAAADIGISWVPDDDWSRGKCGLKVLQYMAAGLPVVANPVGVQTDLVRHGETGFLAETEAEWSEAVGRLTSDPDLRRRLGEAGRRRVVADFAVAVGAARWLDVLKKVGPACRAGPGGRRQSERVLPLSGSVASRSRSASGTYWLLAGVLLVGLLLSLCLYAHTASVTEDGATFIHYARQLAGEVPRPEPSVVHARRGAIAREILDRLEYWCPALVSVEAEEQHPGYPILILVTHQTIGRWLAVDPVLQWTRSAQVGSLLAGCLLSLALYLLGRQLLGTAAGLAAALIVATVPALVCQRVEALSDAPALALLALAAWFAVRLVSSGTPKVRAALLCGLFGGLGYLFRPEAVQVALLTGIVLLGCFVFGPTGKRRRFLLPGLVLALPVVLCCGSYMFLRGAVLTKSAGIVVGQRVFGAPRPDAESSAESGRAPTPLAGVGAEAVDGLFFRMAKGTKRFLLGWSSNLGYTFAGLLLVGVFVRRREICAQLGPALIWSAVLLNGVLLAGVHYPARGYLDPRHVLPATVLTIPWCWPGLLSMAGAMQRWLPGRLGFSGLTTPHLAAGIAVMLAAALGFDGIHQTLHGERNGYRLAGEWLRGRVPLDRGVVDPESLVSLYAGLDGRNFWERDHLDVSADYLDGLLGRLPGVAYVIYSDRYLRDHGLPGGMPRQLGHYRLREARSFAASLDPAYLRRVRIWRVERKASQP